MAIFGSLNEISLIDLVSFVGKGRGHILVTGLPTKQIYALYFHDRIFISLVIDGKPVEDIFELSHPMAYLAGTSSGNFEYVRNQERDNIQQCNFFIPVDQLLLSTMAAVTQLDNFRLNLPNEMTIFISCSQQNDKWLEDELDHFYEACGPLLHLGASGNEIAKHTGFQLERVLLNLYKLRFAGLITPHRAVSRAMISSPPTSSTLRLFTEKPPLRPISSIACIRFDTSDEGDDQNTASSAPFESKGKALQVSLPVPQRAPSAIPDLRKVYVARPVKGFFTRVLSTLGSKLKK